MSLQASFIGSVGPIFFKGYEFSFFLIKTLLIWKISLNSRLIRLDQHEKTFTGKNPRENASNIILLAESVVFSYVAQWKDYVACRQSGFKLQLNLIFFRLFLFV